MGALGYRQLSRHLAGELDLQDAVRETKRDTWRFARRQLNWFRSEPEVRWIADRRELSPAEIAEQLARADRTAG
jgi:tRNA dimethylallyltransferase